MFPLFIGYSIYCKIQKIQFFTTGIFMIVGGVFGGMVLGFFEISLFQWLENKGWHVLRFVVLVVIMVFWFSVIWRIYTAETLSHLYRRFVFISEGQLALVSRLWHLKSTYPPNKFTAEEWKHKINEAGTERQKALLLRTNHQTLGLTPEVFLTLLYEIQPLIKKEPALSAYWERRHQLEEILKQEKRG
jgi:hypothetical protein